MFLYGEMINVWTLTRSTPRIVMRVAPSAQGQPPPGPAARRTAERQTDRRPIRNCTVACGGRGQESSSPPTGPTQPPCTPLPLRPSISHGPCRIGAPLPYDCPLRGTAGSAQTPRRRRGSDGGEADSWPLLPRPPCLAGAWAAGDAAVRWSTAPPSRACLHTGSNECDVHMHRKWEEGTRATLGAGRHDQARRGLSRAPAHPYAHTHR